MKIFRRWLALIATVGTMLFTNSAHAGLSPGALNIDIWSRYTEFTYEWSHSEYRNGVTQASPEPGVLGAFYLTIDGNDLTFQAIGGQRACGDPCLIHIQSTGDEIVAAWLDQATADAGYTSKLGLNSLTNTDFGYFANLYPNGIWFDLTDGIPPNGKFTISVATVPEPETYAMLLAGLGLMGFVARRRKQA